MHPIVFIVLHDSTVYFINILCVSLQTGIPTNKC